MPRDAAHYLSSPPIFMSRHASYVPRAIVLSIAPTYVFERLCRHAVTLPLLMSIRAITRDAVFAQSYAVHHILHDSFYIP